MNKILSLLFSLLLILFISSCSSDNDWNYEERVITPGNQAIDEFKQDENHLGEYQVMITSVNNSMVISGPGYYKKGTTATISFKGFLPDYGSHGSEFIRWIDLTNGETISKDPSFTIEVSKNRLFGAEVKVWKKIWD
ncbi:MAG: hypothetical protein ACRC26_10495 [Bacteroidales bacterium]